ncbi:MULTISPECIES: beta-eliminating lyase-related protein [unclassified Beijerinckia]|uniref:threonine aldolase family protein n=1 Tax=unclassified Beijerinckia TaxID=2638183 RepID=UPI000898BD3B|nr:MULTISPECIES: beta-eliminating lyase-related protein [unclassified Beijerinckia]MDH7793991.1 threonine aldolase [Beijerinckia sp. GAS462]SEB50912.1 L-threonine aldolase [Beijerinckia sp. 28-YEA-48]
MSDAMKTAETSSLDFASDNASGASRKVLEALVAANDGSVPAYGADPFTRRAEERLGEVFERDCIVFLLATGTAANALALAALTPPYGAIFCHAHAHVMNDECGAPEFFSAGAKMIGIEGGAGKITPAALAASLAAYPAGVVKQVQPAALSLSQASESGTLYRPTEVAELAALAHGHGVRVHMDGARFANAVAALGCAPADITWRAGVDVLSLGASKNGAFACEAVIFFDKALAADFAYRRKRGGHTLSKGRFLAVQMLAWLEDGHWLELARHSNARAGRLAAALAAIPGVRLPWSVEANEVFAILPKVADLALKQAGARYYPWSADRLADSERPGRDEVFVRLVTSFTTREADIDRFGGIAADARK